MIRSVAVAAVALLGAAPAKDPLAGRVAGAPVECVSLASTDGPAIERDGSIVYRSGRRWWVTHAVGACPALRPLTTLIVEVHGGQVCRNDRFRVLEPTSSIPSAYCCFDRFVPYDKR